MITRESMVELTRRRQLAERREKSASRLTELVLLLIVSVAIAFGAVIVFRAKTVPLAGFNKEVSEGKLLVLAPGIQPESIAPHLGVLADRRAQQAAAQKIAAAMRASGELRNVGALARTSVLSRSQLAAVKPAFAVRAPGAFRTAFLIWVIAYFAAFYAVHFAWRWREFAGDNVILPAVHALSGVGLLLMISLRDPIRDTLTFVDFSQGAILGCAALFVFSQFDYERRASRYAYVWLLGALLLAAALAVLGSGPGSSDAKVNLFGVQPVEAIRVLLVLFLAGYFGQNWDALRDLKPHGTGVLGAVSRLLHIGRFDYTLPVFAGVATALGLFFILRDMGPALVIGILLLGLYSIARNSFRLAAAGFLVMLAGFWGGYRLGVPHTVSERVAMWRSVWDNSAPGGDQVAQSLWSFATGGVSGTGLGLGNPETIPAGHTDLILSVAGEQLGLLGLCAIFGLYALLTWRSLRIAFRADGPYSFFLVAGLAMINALQILLIAGGILGLIPLTGVVSPFLSYGRSSMLANFAMFGMIVAVSHFGARDQSRRFGAPVLRLALGLAACGLAVLGRAAYFQAYRADQTVVKGSLVMNADGVRRYQYNPRLLQIARQIPRGDIYDRNGLPLATGDWAKVEEHQKEYAQIDVTMDETASKAERRHYPLGPPLFYVIGDARTRLKQGASNTAFQERRSRTRLQGYDDAAEVETAEDPRTGKIVRRVKYDYSELLPLLRHRHEPGRADVKAILDRARDVRITIDARLQMRVARILQANLKQLGKEKGAVVVMDTASGDVLASVSYPWPSMSQISLLDAGGDAPVPEEDILDRVRYGLYPPGSSFKIVTAIAALRADPALASEHFDCVSLPDGRVGNFIKGSRRPIRDDAMDHQPHGSVDLAKGITVSCNAYFAQLGFYKLGAKRLFETARLFDLLVADPNTPEQLKESLAQSSYGQGQVRVSPFQMARVAATIANHGRMPSGRWVLEDKDAGAEEQKAILGAELADRIGASMRSVVTSGTGRRAERPGLAIAGKTGTAELAKNPSHAWFIGYAPYKAAGKTIAFAVLVENGQYGGTAAAPLAAEVVAAAHELGII